MASISIAWRPSMAFARTPSGAVERWLEAERDQLALWLPVALGCGIAGWFVLPLERHWWLLMLASAGAGLLCLATWRGGRAGLAAAVGLACVALGCGIVWWRAGQVAAPPLARPAVVELRGRVERVEPLPARGLVRLRLAPDRTALPPHIRVNVAEADMPAGLAAGAAVALRARLVPPPEAALPGAYDFARLAWFQRLGATGRALGRVTLIAPARAGWREWLADLRTRLSRHIAGQVEGAPGGIATALATGDQGAIPDADADAMRQSGLAHLLSISGLHVTAVVAAAMWLVLRLLALWPRLAIHWPLPAIAAGAGALAGIGYTLISGAEVPTIRSCVAALLVLGGLVLGREAVTLRLVATGALIVLLLWPEALVGPSFQLSFAAVTAIVALHEHPQARALFARRDELWLWRAMRGAGVLLASGIVVEAALMPIAVFHFQRAGVYGAIANIVAIPLTTFVVMPLEAAALLLDAIGAGAPLWWMTGRALTLLLWLAHRVADLPGATAALPSMPVGAFALMVCGGLWLALWRTRLRWAGGLPMMAGAAWTLLTPAPDLLVTGDGRHVAVRSGADLRLLRPRAGDYVRDLVGQAAGVAEAAGALDDAVTARCTADLCRARVGGLTLLATRSAHRVDIGELVAACRAADVVVSDRRLPRTCLPRWLKADRALLARTGGLAITSATGRVVSVRHPPDDHPWLAPAADAGYRPPRTKGEGDGRAWRS